MVVLHGGPGASHDYLRPGFDLLATAPHPHLLRPARRRAVAGADGHPGGLARAGRRPRGAQGGLGPRPADDLRLLLGRAARDAVRHRASRPRRAPGAGVPGPGVARRAARVRADVLGPQHEPRAAGGASGAARERPPRARPRGLSAPAVRALGGAVLRRSRRWCGSSPRSASSRGRSRRSGRVSATTTSVLSSAELACPGAGAARQGGRDPRVGRGAGGEAAPRRVAPAVAVRALSPRGAAGGVCHVP